MAFVLLLQSVQIRILETLKITFYQKNSPFCYNFKFKSLHFPYFIYFCTRIEAVF
jgi:hypothetical protein